MAGDRDENERATDRPPPGTEDVYSADTRVGALPADLLEALKDQRVAPARTVTATRASSGSLRAAAAVGDRVSASIDSVPVFPRLDEEEEPSTRVHRRDDGSSRVVTNRKVAFEALAVVPSATRFPPPSDAPALPPPPAAVVAPPLALPEPSVRPALQLRAFIAVAVIVAAIVAALFTVAAMSR